MTPYYHIVILLFQMHRKAVPLTYRSLDVRCVSGRYNNSSHSLSFHIPNVAEFKSGSAAYNTSLVDLLVFNISSLRQSEEGICRSPVFGVAEPPKTEKQRNEK